MGSRFAIIRNKSQNVNVLWRTTGANTTYQHPVVSFGRQSCTSIATTRGLFFFSVLVHRKDDGRCLRATQKAASKRTSQDPSDRARHRVIRVFVDRIRCSACGPTVMLIRKISHHTLFSTKDDRMNDRLDGVWRQWKG